MTKLQVFLIGCAFGGGIVGALAWAWVHGVIRREFDAVRQHIADRLKP